MEKDLTGYRLSDGNRKLLESIQQRVTAVLEEDDIIEDDVEEMRKELACLALNKNDLKRELDLDGAKKLIDYLRRSIKIKDSYARKLLDQIDEWKQMLNYSVSKRKELEKEISDIKERLIKKISEKNAELHVIQLRIRGVKDRIIPLTKMSNATTEAKKIHGLLTIADKQIDEMTKK